MCVIDSNQNLDNNIQGFIFSKRIFNKIYYRLFLIYREKSIHLKLEYQSDSILVFIVRHIIKKYSTVYISLWYFYLIQLSTIVLKRDNN